MLGLEPRVDVDVRAVEGAYLRRVSLAHPDLVGGAEESEREMARLNDAKRELLDVERRAGLVVKRLERSLGEAKADAKASGGLPDGFLMEMMEVREAIEVEVEREGAAAVARWRAWGVERRGAYLTEVSERIAAGDAAGARVAMNAWRYIERLLEQVG